jgi:hypothetical protein
MRGIYPVVAVVLAAVVGASSGPAMALSAGPTITPAMHDEALVERVAGVDVVPVASLTAASVNGVAITAPVNRTFRTRTR